MRMRSASFDQMDGTQLHGKDMGHPQMSGARKIYKLTWIEFEVIGRGTDD